MGIFADFCKQKTARRIALVDMERADGDTARIATTTYITAPTDTPANALYQARIQGGQSIVIESRAGAALWQDAAFNGGELTVLDPGDELADWLDAEWTNIRIRFGDPAWDLATFDSDEDTTRFNGLIQSIRADNRSKIITLVDNYEVLREPAQSMMEWGHENFGRLRPLCYGGPANVTPMGQTLGGSNPRWILHESTPVEDPAQTRYINHAASTSPAITKFQNGFSLNDDPGGAVTCDPLGVDPDAVSSGSATAADKAGEILQDLLTRQSNSIAGYAQDGDASTIVLDDKASSVSGAYDGYELWHWSVAAGDENQAVIDDYDGPSKTATCSGIFGGAPFPNGTPVADDGYLVSINDGSVDLIRTGPLPESDLVTAAFDQLDIDYAGPIGLWINNREASVDILDYVLGPGGHHHMTPQGKLTVGLVPDPSTETAVLTLTAADIQRGAGVEVERREPPAWRLGVGYDRNHTVSRAGMAGDVTAARLDFVINEYRYPPPREDTTIKDAHPGAQDIQVPSPLTEKSDASTEQDRLWPLLSAPRKWYRAPAYAEALSVPLVSVLEIDYPHHDLDGGKNLVMLNRIEYLPSGQTELELWG